MWFLSPSLKLCQAIPSVLGLFIDSTIYFNLLTVTMIKKKETVLSSCDQLQIVSNPHIKFANVNLW